ncbi:hypothetical protein [Candidatus Methylacidiphilum infernorum]|uniref:DUF1640 domain-containing protein n=1 Tax=Methylacidiphilum infernorum (isolate V4) TaxID=481448 RepID=B3DVL6_METI4|nr:hypothetical protein [Candidatus Methylacidiphilum infernorum]ACD83369.1 Conserved hypothetical protein [Methylacidiphilum infernorum V4]
MHILFDTLKLSKKLEEAGMPAKQAEILSSVLAESLLKESINSNMDLESQFKLKLEARLEKLEAKIEELGKTLNQYFALVMGGIVLLGIILKIHL